MFWLDMFPYDDVIMGKSSLPDRGAVSWNNVMSYGVSMKVNILFLKDLKCEIFCDTFIIVTMYATVCKMRHMFHDIEEYIFRALASICLYESMPGFGTYKSRIFQI